MTTATTTSPATVAHLMPLLERLTLEQKALIVQGAGAWTTAAVPEIGLRAMTLADGPAGVRGARWDERDPSLSLPSGSMVAASWDAALAYRYGAALASEARRKDVDVVLGPTINLHRSPLGGRHFECFSEDPELTGVIAAAFVRGLQDNGVAATPKHYVANDSETDRFTVDIHVDDRALRELYLAPFERAVEAGAWSIMSAYNAVHGVTMTENDLLETPLNSEWGFDGVVVSDWTAVRSLDAISAAQDLAMPGPAPAWGDVVDAIHDGRLDEADLDRKVLRILLLAERVGALGDTTPREPTPVEGPAFAREAAIAGTVLLSNDGVLPVDASAIRSIAVIGHNAREARIQGGGSATVIPEHITSPLYGIREAFPGAEVTYNHGASVQDGVAEFPLNQLANPVTGDPGVRVTFFGADGAELATEDRRSTALVWFDGAVPLAASRLVAVEGLYTPVESGQIHLGFASANPGRIFVDGQLVVDDAPAIDATDLGAAFLNPPSLTAPLSVEAGITRRVRAEFDLQPNGLALALTIGVAPDDSEPDDRIAQAAAAAAASDLAVVVVGTNSKVESEGYDRTDLDLPGRQNDLVRAVAASGTPTIVIVNAGSPVVLPWVDQVSAVLQGYFGGQEFGSALGDVLTGRAEPGGRLPTTWPAALSDVPVTQVTPESGILRYTEGIHIGYRAWLRKAVQPAFWFGHGLGYTSWSWDVVQRHEDVIAVTLQNTGGRAGKQVVQVYAERRDSAVDRPARWLVGFAAVHAPAGATVTARIPLSPRRFAHWDSGWVIESGAFTLRIGASLADLPLSTEWAVDSLTT
jgi:beta-glucosidase